MITCLVLVFIVLLLLGAPIAYCMGSERVAVTRFDPEAVTQFYFQFRDQLYNDLTLNGIVFTVEDYVAP